MANSNSSDTSGNAIDPSGLILRYVCANGNCGWWDDGRVDDSRRQAYNRTIRSWAWADIHDQDMEQARERELQAQCLAEGREYDCWESDGNEAKAVTTPQNGQCAASLSSGVGSARTVFEMTATGADIATVGFTAGGITAPIAIATKLVGYGAEAGLIGVNLYDGFANGYWGALQVQASGAATRLIPGGRTLQAGARIARGPTGILRNSRGQFRTSPINDPTVAEAGDLAVQKSSEVVAGE